MGLKLLILILAMAYSSACGKNARPIPEAAPTPTPKVERTPMTLDCPGLNFTYQIAGNDMWSEKIRHIYLYLEPKAFNQKNLRQLFACVSKANPDPVNLIAELNTDWSRLPDPSSTEPGSGCGGCKEDPHKYDFLQAKYVRREHSEYFKYSPVTHVKDWDFTTVVIRGKKPN